MPSATVYGHHSKCIISFEGGACVRQREGVSWQNGQSKSDTYANKNSFTVTRGKIFSWKCSKSIWRPVSVWTHWGSLQRSSDLLAGFRGEGSPGPQLRVWQDMTHQSSLLWRTMALSAKFKSIEREAEHRECKGKWIKSNGGKEKSGEGFHTATSFTHFNPCTLLILYYPVLEGTNKKPGTGGKIGWLCHCLHCYCCYYGWCWPAIWWSHAN